MGNPFDPDDAYNSATPPDPTDTSDARVVSHRAAAPCQSCGYDLIGHLVPMDGAQRQCPECGAKFIWRPALQPAIVDPERASGAPAEVMSATRRRLRRVETWILVVILVGVMVVPLVGWLIMVAVGGP